MNLFIKIFLKHRNVIAKKSKETRINTTRVEKQQQVTKTNSNDYSSPDVTETSVKHKVGLKDKDDLFEDAARLVVRYQQTSATFIQRNMAIGYNRSSRIIDQLEIAGIVGPYERSKTRQVFFTDEYSLEEYLNSLNEN